MPDPIIINGKKFVTSKQGAALTGYARDYIGQLVRMGKVEGKVVEKTLFVSQDSLLAHLELKNGNAKIVENSFKSAIAENTAKVNLPKTTPVSEPVLLFPKLTKVISKPAIIKTDKIVSKFKNKSSVPAVVAVIAPYADAIGKISSYALKHAIGVVAVLTVLTTSYASIKSPESFLRNMSEVFSNNSEVVEGNTASLFAPVRTLAMNVNKSVNDFFGLGTSGTTIVQLPPKVFVATSTIVREVVRDIGTTTIIRYGSTAAPVVIDNTQNIDALVAEVNILKRYQKEQLEGIFDSVARGRRTTTITTTSSTDLSGTTTLTNLTVENTSTSTIPNLNVSSSLTLNGDIITDFVGSGLELSNGVLSATAGAGFSTTSSDFHFNTRLAATTTLNNLTTLRGLTDLITTNATTTTFALGADYITDLTGSGLSIVNGALTVSGANGFSTTSADYWETQQVARWATTSDSYAFDTRLAATTTLNNITTLGSLSLPITQTTGTLSVARGGTGQTSFGQGWLSSDGTTLTSSTSPTVAYITATSTTATSTLHGNSYGADGIVLGANDKIYSSDGLSLFDTNNALSRFAFSTNNTYAASAAGQHRFNIGASQVAVIDASGNLGIGTSSPYAKLSVTNTGTGPSFLVEDSTSPDVTPFIIDANGNVGIGTTTPGQKLEVMGVGRFDGTNTFSIGSDTNYKRIDTAGSGGQIFRFLSAANALTGIRADSATFGSSYGSATAPTNGMLIQGAVGIGTSSPATTLHIEGTNSVSGGLSIYSTAGTANGRLAIYPSGNTSTVIQKLATNGVISYLSSTGVEEMRIGADGSVGIGTTSPYAKLSVVGQTVSEYFTATSTTATSTFPKLSSTYLQVGSDTLNDFTGAGILNVGGALTLDTSGLWATTSDSFAFDTRLAATTTLNNLATLRGLTDIISTRATTTNATSTNFFATTASSTNLFSSALTVGSNALVVTSAGNVGIGTSTPAGLLNVASTLPYIYLTDTNSAANNKHWFMENNAGVFSLGTTSDSLAVTNTRALAITNAGVLTSAGPVYTSAGGAGGVGTNLLATANYIQSRGMNLVANGSGLLGNDYNFSQTDFYQADTHGGKGSFKFTSTGSVLSDEYIPVDGTRTYRLSAWLKSIVTGAKVQYLGVAAYDIDNYAVSPTHYQRVAGTETTLAADLNPGDSVIQLTSATNWNNSANYAYSRQIQLFNYANSYGYTYPAYTYTRNTSSNYANYSTNGAWAAGGISGNNITLTEVWPASLGTIPAGTAVSNGSSGGTYKYMAASSVTPGNTWTNYTGYIGGWDTTGANATNLFPYGTASIKILWLANYNGVSTMETLLSDVWFSEISANNLEIATASQQGVISTSTQTLGGIKTFTDNAIFSSNVGIGTTSPYAKLSVTNTGTTPSFLVEDSTSPDSTPFIIDASGNVGIGSTAPNAKATIIKDSNGLSNSSPDNYAFTIAPSQISQSSAGISIGTFGSTLYKAIQTFDGPLSLNPAGNNVGIATTSPYAKLSVVGQTVSEYFTATSTSATSTFPLISTNAITLNGNYATSFWSTTTDSLAFDTRLAATTTLNNITTLRGLTDTITTRATTTNATSTNFFATTASTTNLFVGGMIGVGTSSPQAAIHAYSDTGIISDSASGGIGFLVKRNNGLIGSLISNTMAGVSVPMFQGNGQRIATLSNNSSSFAMFQWGDSTGNLHGIVSSTGSFGIGTTSPYAKLSVVGQTVSEYFTATSTTATSTFPLLSVNALSLNGVYTNALWATTSDSFAFDTRLAATTTLNRLNTLGGLASIGSTTGTTTFLGGAIFNGNVGIGTTTPLAKLQIVDNTTAAQIWSNSAAGSNMKDWRLGFTTTSLFLGTLNESSSAFGDAAITIGRETSSNDVDYIDFAVNNEVNKMRFTNAGNFGIGTTTPQSTLSVAVGSITAGQLKSGLILGGSHAAASGGTSIDFQVNGITNNMSRIGSVIGPVGTEGELVFYTTSSYSAVAPTEKIRINGAGNLGIGTTSPYAKLSVVGQAVAQYFTATSTTATSTFPLLSSTAFALGSDYITDLTGSNLSITNGALTVTLDGAFSTTSADYWETTQTRWATTSDTFAFDTRLAATTTLNRLNTLGGLASIGSTTGTTTFLGGAIFNGNVGIGTTSPSQLLTVGNNNQFTVSSAGAVTAAGTIINSSYTMNAYLDFGSNSQSSIRARNSADLTFLTGATDERMRILQSNGNVGIGTTSPYAKLSVVGQTVAEYFTATSTTATSTFPLLSSTAFALGSDYITDLTGSGLSIANGALTVSGGSFSTTSADYYLAATTTLNNLTKIGPQTTFSFDHATGTSLYLTSLNCTVNSNGGKITTDSSGQLVCANDQTGAGGGGGSDVNWTFFNNSGISVGTTSNQVVIGASATSSTQKLEVIGGVYINGNVGIGTTSPYAKLSVVGTGVFTNVVATSTTADSVFPRLTSTFSTTTNATTTNFFATTASTSNLFVGNNLSISSTSQAANLVIERNDGLNAIFLGRSGAGSATLGISFANGIPTIAPSAGALNIASAITDGSNKNMRLTFAHYNAVASGQICAVVGGTDATSNNLGLGGGSSGCNAATSLALYTSANTTTTTGTVGFVMDSVQNIGIGTQLPTAKLHLVGRAGSTTDIFKVASSTGEEYFTIKSTGNIGIGTSSPYAKLSVNGDVVALTYTATSTTATSTFPLLSTNALSLNGTYVTSFWATTSDSFAFDTRLVATTTLNNLTTLRGLTDIISTRATTTNATSTSLSVSTFGIGNDYITDLTGSNLSIVNGALTATDLTFSTTSADYWETTQTRWATTSDSYAFDTRLAATTTLNNITTLGSLSLPITQTTGTLSVARGGTGLTTFTNNQLLVGNASGAIAQIATSSLGLLTTDVAEGSNLYFTNARADARIAATTSLPNISTLAGLVSVGSSTGTTVLNGTIGIGTTSPYAKLSVVGQTVAEYFTATSTTATSTFPLLSTNALSLNGTYVTSFWATTSDSFAFDTRLAATTTLNNIYNLGGLATIGSTTGTTTFLGGAVFNGNVGIGTTTPYAKLSVTNTGTGPSFIVEDATSPDGTPFIIDASGNVGIGTATMSGKLNIEGGAVYINSGNVSAGTVLYNKRNAIFDSGEAGTVALNVYGRTGQTADIFQIGSTTSAGDIFTVRANGNIGIGTSSPYAKLSVNGDVVALTYTATSTTATSTFPLLSTNALSLNGTYVTSFWATTSDSFAFDTRLAATTTLNNLTTLRGLTDIISTRATTTNATSTNFFATTASTTDLFVGGSLGMGTSSPQAKLSFADHTTAAGGIKFGSDVNLYRSGAGVLKTDTAIYATQGFYAPDNFGFNNSSTGNNAFFKVNTNGPLISRNIADTNPSLIVQQVHSGSTGDIVQLKNNASTLFVVQQDGDVGIGTTSPYAKLSVVGQTVAEYFTATSTTATSTFPLLSTNALSLNGTYVTSFWATTSDSFAFDTRLAATTTLNNITNLNRVTLNAATTSSLAVTGILSSLLKTNSDGSVVSAIAGTDYLASAITAIGPANQTQTGATVTIASSTSTTNGLTAGITIVGSGNTLTLTPALSGVLTVGGGGTGISSPAAGGILVGNYSGNGWQQIATSSLGLLTTDVAEGSNLYWTNNRFDVRLSATTTLSNLATLAGLVSIGSTSATTTFRGNVNVTGQTAMNGATIETNTGLTVLGAVDSGDSTYAVRGNARGSNTTFGALGYDNTTACTGICSVAGVYGETTNGKAIVGSASGATGVAGYFSSATGNAVETYSTDGYGLSVSSTNSRGLSVSGSTYSIYATGGQNYFEGNIGVGTTSPYAALAVVGQAVAEYYTATSTIATSTFPRLSSTQIAAVGVQDANESLILLDGSDDYARSIAFNESGLINGAVTYDHGLNVFTINNALSGPITLNTNNTERVRISSAGNMGIGTTSPYAKLSVVGQTVAEYFTATSTTATSTFPLLSTNALSLNGTYVTSFWATTSDSFAFDTRLAATTTLNNIYNLGGLATIGSTTGTTIVNGKLGVATSSPWAKLSVSQTGAAPAFAVEDSASDSTPFVIDESGNVAIGTSTPTAKLEIAGGTSGDRVRFITVGGASNRTLDFDRTIATGAWSIQSYVSSSLVTKMPILLNPNGGGIAIGTTSTTLPATLAVGGSIYSEDGIYAGGGIYSPGEIQAGRLIATTTKTQFISNTNVTTLYTYGDSITQGSNASSSSEYYPNILAKTLKYTLINQGIAGSLLEEDAQIDSIYDQPVSTTTVATILTGYNNHRYYGTSAARLDTYKQALPAALAYLAIPDKNKKYGYDFSTTGTWAATSTYATSTGRFSRTAGSTASTVLHGNTIYVVGTRGAANDTGTMTITVDGVDKGTYSCAGTLASSNDSRVYAPFMMRVGNLSNGPHTVKVTSNTTGYCEINWASGNANVSADGAPAVYVGGALRMTDADYITNGVGGNIASNRLYNQVIEGTVKILASDGLNVIKVDAEEAYDAATMVSYDRVHPNAAGHSMLAQVFLNKMSGTSFGNDKNFARFFSGYVPKFTIGAGTSTTFTFDGETGRFGIGSSTPLATLSLTGTAGTDPLLIASSTGSHMLTVVQSGNVGVGSSTPFGRFSVDSSNLLAGVPSFVVGSSTEADLIVLQNGNVGLGTTTPYAKLAIDTSDTTSSANAAFMVGSSTKTDFMIGGASGNISIGTTTNTRAKVTISNLGNMPSLFLDGGLAGSDMFRFVRSNANGGTGNYGLALKIQNSNPAFLFRSGTSAVSEGTSVNGFVHLSSTNSFLMSTTSSLSGTFSGYEPMYMTNSNANIGFAGTTTPFGSVSINGVFQSAGEPTFVIGSSTKTDLIVTQGGNIGVGTTSPWRTFSTNGTVAMNGLTTAAGTPSSICMNATTKEITVNAATSCVVSDRDQKQQIEDLTVSGLDAIRAIKPVTFAYNDIPGRSRIGFIAQDLQAVDNRLGDAFDKQGIARSIDIPAILSITVKAVKELDVKTELQASTTESRFLEVIGTKPSSADNFLINGDLSFKNKFGIKTESTDSPTKYLTIHSSDGSNIVTFAENGNIGIGLGSSTPAYKLQVQGDIAATAFVNISTMESKTGIKYLTDEKKEDILTALNKMKIAQYRYKSEDQSNPLRLGLIAEEAPSEVLSVSGKGVDIYKLTTFTLAAVQAQQKKIESFETRLTALEAKVASSTATTTDSMIASVIAGIKNLFVDELTVGTKEKATGITLFDDETGAPFCIKISGGTMKSTEGACGTTTKPKEEVKEDPKPTIPAPTQNATSTASTTPPVKEIPKEPVASSTPSTGGSTAPKPEAPKVEETKPVEVTPAPEAPKEEAPKPEETKPVEATPAPEAPKEEAPKVEEKKEEAPAPEAPKEEAPKPSETASAPSVDSTN